jgi:hypothetical protein
MSRIGAGKALQLIVTFGCVTLLLIVSGACQTPNGLIKTPLADRIRKEYPSLATSIELPKQSRNIWAQYTLSLDDGALFQSNVNVRAELTLGMDPWWPGVLDEARRLVFIHVTRLTPQEYDKFTRGDNWYLNKIYGDHRESLQEKITTYTFRNKHDWCAWLILWRKIPLRSGDVVIGAAKVADDEGLLPDKEQDISAIKDILNSIQPIE